MEDSTTECDDGTICENYTPCVSDPIEEGSYLCDCTTTHYLQWRKQEGHSSDDGQHGEAAKYTGVYCEHVVTTYCESGSLTSAHAFCANEGECEAMVGRDEEHTGCKCPAGYEGDHCQFVAGTMPSDWSAENSTNSTHLSLPLIVEVEDAGAVSAPYFGAEIFIIITFATGAAALVAMIILSEVCHRTSEAKAADPQRADVAGGESVGRRKASTGQFVTEDTLEADGGVLTRALEARNNTTGKGAAGMEDLVASMQFPEVV